MESIRNIFRTGYGPSSSHTMGPARAAEEFIKKHPDAEEISITLYGSLAATGRGHLTDKALVKTLHPLKVSIIWKPDVFLPEHANGMVFQAVTGKGTLSKPWKVFSTGGGALSTDAENGNSQQQIYRQKNMKEVIQWCSLNGSQIWELVFEAEGEQIEGFLAQVWETMQRTVSHGLESEGVLPGGLGIPRKAALYLTRSEGCSGSLKRRASLFAFALAAAEENASGGQVVTAPTCGSCGVLPGVLYYMKHFHRASDSRILRALATAGFIGAIVRRNGSISGAEVGCQGEIGTACAMAAGAVLQLFGGSPKQVEYAAEMGLEHHLGLTCDPVKGMVQVPCIERNAFAASRAMDANAYAIMSDGTHKIDFDHVVKTMLKTGHDLPSLYRETALGGLASEYP
ncbi:serine dehydratase [Candidatus Fermentibacteria bacterium]|nr:MAG: serine dehydratase [Candidatus Fermentibacteria bacterium]